jgi:CO/xanthine dehydrogenase Mo-binding subunit
VVAHPQGIATQIKGGAVMGLGMARLEHRVYDPQTGLPANVGLHQAKPPTWLDLPQRLSAETIEGKDPDNPFGMKGVGEPPTGAAAAAILCAISDGLGGTLFNRVPVTLDMIVNALAGLAPPHAPLQPHAY